jgi:penicillin-binding protein-related factor A (putative recombinase)
MDEDLTVVVRAVAQVQLCILDSIDLKMLQALLYIGLLMSFFFNFLNLFLFISSCSPLQHYYLRNGGAYRGSLFELARFERIGEQFGVPTSRVKKLFEAQYKEMKAAAAPNAQSASGDKLASSMANLSINKH